jgi:hypothetical protein
LSIARRWTARVRANASIEESRRFCRAMTTSMPAALAATWGAREAGLAELAVALEEAREGELGGVVGEAGR